MMALDEKSRDYKSYYKLSPWGEWMSEPNFMVIHPIAVKTFHSEPQIWTSWWRERKSQAITKVIMIHPLGIMNVSTKFCANPWTRCWDILLDRWKLSSDGSTTWKVWGWPDSLGYILWGTWMSVQKSCGNPLWCCWDISAWTKVVDRPTTHQWRS